MTKPPRFVGVELYFDDLSRAKSFYTDVLGLGIIEEASSHFAKFGGDTGLVCLERKGAESYPSRDKAVLFFEVDDLARRVAELGDERFVQVQAGWAVLHDPEGHNILLSQRRT